jgi:hypothetical protein
VLVFRLQRQAAAIPAPRQTATASPSNGGTAATVAIGGETIPLDQIRAVVVHTTARFPHLFSWWVLLSVALLLLLPIRIGPVLVFRLQRQAGEIPQPLPPSTASPSNGGTAATVAIGGETIRLDQIRAVVVHTTARFPHLFSWWVLLSVALLLLLPIRIGPVGIFWPLQIALLVAAVLLGSRKRHTLQVDLRDGRARRHAFSNRRTALAHRNGIRQALSPGADPVQPGRAR